MKTAILPIALIQISMFAMASQGAPIQDIRGHLARWREHILTNGNLGGVELSSPDYKELIAMGPGILPEVFETYRQEQNVHVLYYIGILIRRLGHFDAFSYTTEPMTIGRRQLEHHGEKPFLSRQIGPRAPTAPARVPDERDQLVQWWDQRASFLNRSDVTSRIRAITGQGVNQFACFDSRRAREIEKLQVYGIYNIPEYIRVVALDNNPVVFCDFLRITNNPFYSHEMTNDMPNNVEKVAKSFPSVIEKLKVICEWWERSRQLYDGLEALQAKIDNAVGEFCDSH